MFDTLVIAEDDWLAIEQVDVSFLPVLWSESENRVDFRVTTVNQAAVPVPLTDGQSFSLQLYFSSDNVFKWVLTERRQLYFSGHSGSELAKLCSCFGCVFGFIFSNVIFSTAEDNQMEVLDADGYTATHDEPVPARSSVTSPLLTGEQLSP